MLSQKRKAISPTRVGGVEGPAAQRTVRARIISPSSVDLEGSCERVYQGTHTEEDAEALIGSALDRGIYGARVVFRNSPRKLCEVLGFYPTFAAFPELPDPFRLSVLTDLAWTDPRTALYLCSSDRQMARWCDTTRTRVEFPLREVRMTLRQLILANVRADSLRIGLRESCERCFVAALARLPEGPVVLETIARGGMGEAWANGRDGQRWAYTTPAQLKRLWGRSDSNPVPTVGNTGYVVPMRGHGRGRGPPFVPRTLRRWNKSAKRFHVVASFSLDEVATLFRVRGGGKRRRGRRGKRGRKRRATRARSDGSGPTFGLCRPRERGK